MRRFAASIYVIRSVPPIGVGIGAGLLVMLILIFLGVGGAGNVAVGLSILTLTGIGVGLLAWSLCGVTPGADRKVTQQTGTGGLDLSRYYPEAERKRAGDKPIRADRGSKLAVR